MKMVLSNAKKYLSVLLAMAMIVLSIPSAPVQVLAAAVDESATEAVESTETVDATSEDIIAETTDTAEEIAVQPEISEIAEEGIAVDTAAAGVEDDIQIDSQAAGAGATLPMYAIVTRNSEQDDAYVALSSASNNVIYLAIGGEGTVVASATDNGNARKASDPMDDVIEYGSTGSFSAADSTIVSVTADPAEGRIAVIKGLKAGTTTITGTFRDMAGNTYTTERGFAATVVVYELTGTPADTKYASFSEEGQSAEMFSLKISANDEDGVLQKDISGNITYAYTSGNGAGTDNVTWNTAKLNEGKIAIADVLDPSGEVSAARKVYSAKGAGEAYVTATFVPAGAITGDSITLKSYVAVANIQNNIIATKTGAESAVENIITNNELACVNPTGNEWKAAEGIEKGESVVYDLKALYDDGTNNTASVTFVRQNNGRDVKADLTISGSTLTIKGTYKGTFEENIYEKNANGIVVGLLKLHWVVDETGDFGFVNYEDGKTSIDDAKKYAILPRAEVKGSGSGITNNNQAVLATPLSIDLTTNWDPTSNSTVSSQSVATASYNGDTYARARIYEASANGSYGDQTVTVQPKGKSVSDEYLIRVVDATIDGEKPLEVVDGSYKLQLNIACVTDNVTTNTTYNAYGVTTNVLATANSGIIIYGSADGTVSNNTAYAESVTLSVLGGGAGTVTIDQDEVKTITANGFYKIGSKSIGLDIVPNAGVIKVSGGTITAVAPGNATFEAVYKDGNKEWKIPVAVEVVEMRKSVNGGEVTTNASRDTIAAGQSVKFTSKVSVNGVEDVSGVTYTYTIKEISQNGNILSEADNEQKAKIEKIKANAVISGSTLQTTKNEEAFDTDTGITVETTAQLMSSGGAVLKEIDTTSNMITVLKASDTNIGFTDTSIEYLAVGESALRSITGNNGKSELTASTAPENVVTTSFVTPNYNGITINAVKPGTARVSVGVDGITGQTPITLDTVVYGIETNENLVLSDNGKVYELTVQKFGDVYDNNIQLNVTNGSTVADDNVWTATGTGYRVSQNGVLTIAGTAGKSAEVKVQHTDRPEGKEPVTTTLTINVTVKESTVELKEETANKIMDATTDDLAQFTLKPTGTIYRYDAEQKKEVTENGYGEGVVLSANVGSEKIAKVARNEDNTFTITPVGVGQTTVTLNAYNGDTKVTSGDGAVYTIQVQATPTFKKKGTTASTDAVDAASATMNAFTNYAVTAVSEKQATAWSSDPTLEEAVMFNEEGTVFNDGWVWDVPTKKLSTLVNAATSGSIVTATANYVIAGNVVTTNEVKITPYTVKELELNQSGNVWADKNTLSKTESNVYSARLGTKKNNLGVTVSPVIYKMGEYADTGEADALWNANQTLSATSSKTTIVGPVVNKDKKSLNLNTTSTSGEADVTIVANGLFNATINAVTAPEDEMATLIWTNSTGTLTSKTAPVLDNATALQNSSFVINLDSTVKRDNFYVAVPVSDVTGNIIKSDENARGDINVSSSDPSVVELGGSLMNQVSTSANMFGTGKEGYIYTMDLTAESAGKTTIKVTGTDKAATTLQFTLNVVDGKQPTFAEVTLSNAKKTNTAQLDATFDDSWFESGVTGNAEGLVVLSANVLGDATGYFTIANDKNVTWQATDPTKVATGTYNVTLRGKSALAYQNSADAYVSAYKSTLFADYTAIPLVINVTDRAMIKPTISDVTIKQAVNRQDLEVNAGSGYTATSVRIKDADADTAAAAGITISGTTISAAKDAVPGNYKFSVVVEADNIDATKVGGIGDATINVRVEESDAPVPTVNNGILTMVRGETATLSATWSDDEARTNTFTLTAPVTGFTLSGDKLTAGASAKEGTNELTFTVSGTDANGKVTNGTAKVKVTVAKFDPNVTLASSSVTLRLGKTATLPVSNPSGYQIANYRFEATSSAALGGAATLSTDGVLTGSTDEAKVGTYSALTVLVDVSNGTDTIEGVALTPLTISVKKSGADQHEGEKPADAADDMTVNYIMPDLTYDGTAKTLQNLQVFWNGSLLTLNTDYTVKYANNKNVGTGTCTITGKGSYQQTMTINMPIVARDISESGDFAGEFTAESVTVKSSDKVSNAKVKLYWNGKAMKYTGNTPEYTFQIGSYDEATSRAEVTLKGVGNFTGEKTAYVYVVGSNKDAKSLTVKFTKKAAEMVVGKGGTMYPAFTVKGGGSQTFSPDSVDSTTGQVPQSGTITVAEGKTIDYHFEGGDRAGKSYLVIEVEEPTQIGTATYLGNKTQVYTIKSDMKFTKDTVKLATADADLYYNGLAKTVEVTIKDGDDLLDEGEDYVLTYKNNIKAGNATATVTGLGAYAGNKYNLTFKILKPTVSFEEVAVSAPITKTGAIPYVSVKLMNGETEVAWSSYHGTYDWTYSYKANKKVGNTATVTIKGKGNLQGTDSKTYQVTQGEFDEDVYPEGKVQDVKYTEKALADIKAGKKNPIVQLYGKNLTKTKDYTVDGWSYSSDTWDAETGYIDVYATITGTGDYKGTTTIRAFHIYAGDTAHKINTKTWTVKNTLVYPDTYLYTDNINAGAMDGSYNITSWKSGKPNAKSATYSITVRGEGAYGGTATFKYQVLPADIHAAE